MAGGQVNHSLVELSVKLLYREDNRRRAPLGSRCGYRSTASGLPLPFKITYAWPSSCGIPFATFSVDAVAS
jgi:hypothetical protein